MNSNNGDACDLESPLLNQLFGFLRQQSDSFSDSSHLFGKYCVRKLLCAGKYSCVLLAFDPQLRREVVLKAYRPDLTDEHRELALNEGQALSQIRSEYVAKCLAIESVGEHLVLVLEYIPGQTLDALPVPLEKSLAAAIVSDICEAIQVVHNRGILHLDLKPSNIILSDDGRAVLIDFGLAQPISDVRFGKISGTPNYMAPEVAAHDLSSIDARSDIYGIGAVWLFLLTGKSPDKFEDSLSENKSAETSTIVSEPGPILKKCLVRNPGQRYSSIADLQSNVAAEQKSLLKKPRSKAALVCLAAILLVTTLSLLLLFASTKVQPLSALNVVRAINEDKILSAELANKLPDDFRIECSVDGEKLTKGEALRFVKGDEPQLVVECGVTNFLAVFGIEYTEGTDCLHLKLFSEGVVKCEKDTPFLANIPELSPGPKDKDEFFLIVGVQENWDAAQFSLRANDLLNGQTRGTNGAIDFLEKTEFGEAVRVFPYRVEAKSLAQVESAHAAEYRVCMTNADNAILEHEIEQAIAYVEKGVEFATTAENRLAQVKAMEILFALNQVGGLEADESWVNQKLAGLPQSYTKLRIQGLRKSELALAPAVRKESLPKLRESLISELRGDILAKRMHLEAALSQYQTARNGYDKVFGSGSLPSSLVKKKERQAAHKFSIPFASKEESELLDEVKLLEKTIGKHLGADHLDVLTVPLIYAAEANFQKDRELALELVQRFLKRAEAIQDNVTGDNQLQLDLAVIHAHHVAGLASIFLGSGKQNATQWFDRCGALIGQQTPTYSVRYQSALLSYDQFQSQVTTDSSHTEVGEKAFQQFEELLNSSPGFFGPHERELRWKCAIAILTLAGYREFQSYRDQVEGISLVESDIRREQFYRARNAIARQQYQAGIKSLSDLGLQDNMYYLYTLARLADLTRKENLFAPGTKPDSEQLARLQHAERQASQAVKNYESNRDDSAGIILKHIQAKCQLACGKTNEAIANLLETKLAMQKRGQDAGTRKWRAQLENNIARAYLHRGSQQQAFESFFDSIEMFAGLVDFTGLSGIELFDASKRLRKQLQSLIATMNDGNPQQVRQAYRAFYGIKAISFGTYRNRGLVKRESALANDYQHILPEEKLDQLAKLIPQDATILDFYFSDRDDELCPERCYSVFAISNVDGELDIKFARLGDAAEIDYWIMRLNPEIDLRFASRGTSKVFRSKQLTKAADYIRHQVWDKVASIVSDDCERLVICGDMTLGRIAWPMVAADENQSVSEKYLVSSHPSSRDFFISQLCQNRVANKNALTLGSFEYGMPTKNTECFEELSKAKDEMDLFAKFFQQQGCTTTTCSGDSVTKQEVKTEIEKANVVHISAHFGCTDGYRVNGLVKNPWQTCYLPLSGFNKFGLKNDQNHIRAKDVLELDLRNLELVILSGCSTAGGNRVPGDGIVSFQRAFLAAGAQSILACHWPVRDEFAKAFVEEFLGQVSKFNSYGRALQEAQKKMRNNGWPEEAHAGWTLMGGTVQ